MTEPLYMLPSKAARVLTNGPWRLKTISRGSDMCRLELRRPKRLFGDDEAGIVIWFQRINIRCGTSQHIATPTNCIVLTEPYGVSFRLSNVSLDDGQVVDFAIEAECEDPGDRAELENAVRFYQAGNSASRQPVPDWGTGKDYPIKP